MSKKDYSPLTPGTMIVGMPLRDYFAAKAMAAIILADGIPYVNNTTEHARLAYAQADAMIEAREEGG